MSKINESRPDAKIEANQHHTPHHHLSFPNQEERIRQVFRIPDDALLPSVNEDALEQYYAYFVERLSLPFDAIYCQNSGKMRQLIHYIRVLEVAHPREIRQSSLHGLYCKVENTKQILHLPLTELGVREDNPNCQLLDDYNYWFVNWR